MIKKETYFTIREINEQAEDMMHELHQEGLRHHSWIVSHDATALIVTDMQRYFLDPLSHAFIPSAPAIVSDILSLVSLFKDLKLPVILTRHLNNPANAGNMASWWSDLIDEKSDLSQLISELDDVADHIVVKNQYDAFYKTDLEDFLYSKKIESLIITGVMTNLCCETTARSAFVRGIAPVLPINTTATYSRQMHLSTFRNLSFGFSPLMTSGDIIKKFNR